MRAKLEAEPVSQTETEKANGADMLMKALKEEQVEILFGYPGGAVLPIYDALYKAPIKHVLARHEQGAIHAAEGYARVSGKPGVVIATSGPGATNLVTGIADAMMDSLPLVIFTGQVASGVIGTDAFQEADVVGITMPITKHNYQVRDIKDLPRVVKEAFHIASTGRPGPVLVDIPKDLTVQEAPQVKDVEMDLPGYQPNFYPNPLQLRKLVDAIKVSKRPVILAGAGVLHGKASEELKNFAESYDLPVIHTLLGLGGFPADHSLFLGMAGMHGCYTSNMALYECDLLINIGARFDDRLTGNLATFAPKAKVVHIDIDPAEIGKNVTTHIPIVADSKQALLKILEHQPARGDTEGWHRHLQAYKLENPFWYTKTNDVLSPQLLIEQVYEMTNGEAIVTTDVGQHQMWAAQYYSFKKPNNWVTSGGLGTMGFGFPAAIGAQLANPSSKVVAFVGDGGFQMTLQELVLLKELNLPVKVVLLNNSTLGMVRQWQETFYEERYSQSLFSLQPDFVKLAESYGIKGYRVKTQEEAETVLKEALTSDEPVLIDCLVNPKENVYPMVAPGKGIHEMLGVKP
ncbi:acetolactate synthase large subunit [Rossellomorea aquimaris]|uniref:Acetolactate synthase n=1 Tax=Rossellomorea aquimaris TaxID=189382 RepID=A0A1J6WQX1_9BACI|nr:acetolactate synthase large subunit [Rossellomorea aquimaris]OIU70319.1 acetolactate synthase, large subunit, biosynthetic type [Rossellomorea aquimaris]